MFPGSYKAIYGTRPKTRVCRNGYYRQQGRQDCDIIVDGDAVEVVNRSKLVRLANPTRGTLTFASYIASLGADYFANSAVSE